MACPYINVYDSVLGSYCKKKELIKIARTSNMPGVVWHGAALLTFSPVRLEGEELPQSWMFRKYVWTVLGVAQL